MNETEALEALMTELEFELADDNVLCLYKFSWILNDYRDHFGDEEINRICHAGFEEINRRHRLRLVWVDWPPEPELARDVEPGTPLDFEVSATGEVKSPLQALIDLD